MSSKGNEGRVRDFSGLKVLLKGWWPILLVSLAAFYLRFYDLSFQSFNVEEGLSWFFSRGLFSDIPGNLLKLKEIHPPLYFFMLNLWMMVGGGDSEFMLRLPSAFFSFACVPLMYLLGIRILQRKVAILGSLLMAVSAFVVPCSQEARMYAVGMFLALASFYFLWRWQEERQAYLGVLYAAATIMALYTHYFFLFMWVGQIVFMFLQKEMYETIMYHWIAALAVIAIFFLPWVPSFFEQASFEKVSLLAPAASFGDILVLVRDLSFSSIFSEPGTSPSRAGLDPMIILGLISLCIVAAGYLDLLDKQKAFLGAYFLLPLVCAFGLAYFTSSFHIFLSKYFMLTAPAFYLLLANGMFQIRSRIIFGLVVALFIFINCQGLYNWFKVPYYGHAEWREIAASLSQRFVAGDLIVVQPDLGRPVLLYYLRDRYPVGGYDVFDPLKVSSDFEGYSRFWFCSMPNHPICRQVQAEELFRKIYYQASIPVTFLRKDPADELKVVLFQNIMRRPEIEQPEIEQPVQP